MRILGKLLGYRPVDEKELAEIHERVDDADQRLDEARTLTRDAQRRLAILEARVRLHRETIA